MDGTCLVDEKVWESEIKLCLIVLLWIVIFLVVEKVKESEENCVHLFLWFFIIKN